MSTDEFKCICGATYRTLYVMLNNTASIKRGETQ